jgi:hypothetical protein
MKNLDAKIHVCFFNGQDAAAPAAEMALCSGNRIGDSIVWVIDDFMSKEECAHIAAVSHEHTVEVLDDAGRTVRRRALLWDDGGTLVSLIEERLVSSDHCLERLNEHFVPPFGFHHGVVWEKNTPWVNTCLRVTETTPETRGLGWHRDAPYTEAKNIKSNYTFLLYLDSDVGATEFLPNDPTVVHRGQTVEEEIRERSPTMYWKEFQIDARVGRAVIFDQRLLHRGISTGVKRVLRTDLVCSGSLPKEIRIGEAERLACAIFRTGQLHELDGAYARAGECYERATSLRLGGGGGGAANTELWTKVVDQSVFRAPPSHGGVGEGVKIAAGVSFCERTGRSYTFRLDRGGAASLDEQLRVAAAFCVVTQCAALDPGHFGRGKTWSALRRVLVSLGVEPSIEKADCDGVAVVCEQPKFRAAPQLDGWCDDEWRGWKSGYPDYCSDDDDDESEYDSDDGALNDIKEKLQLGESKRDEHRQGALGLSVGCEHMTAEVVRCSCNLGSPHTQGVEEVDADFAVGPVTFEMDSPFRIDVGKDMVSVTAPASRFHHASCNCTTMLLKCRKCGVSYPTTATELAYTLDGDILTMQYSPIIVM